MRTGRHSTDVAIAGAGIAGIAAAIEALDRGRRVILVDRDVEENLGGQAKDAFGGLWFAGTPLQRRRGIKDSAELGLCRLARLRRARARSTPGRAPGRGLMSNAACPRSTTGSPHSASASCRCRCGSSAACTRQATPCRASISSGARAARSPIASSAGCSTHPRRDLLELRFGHRVDALVTRAGTGLRASRRDRAGGEPFEVASESVVIAAGGINGDIERVRRHWHADWGTPPHVILNGSHRFADGRLHDAARPPRAPHVTHLDWQWNYAAGIRHWRPRKPGHGLSLIPPKSALWLNARGERIGPMPLVSGFDTHDLVARICREPGGYSWQLLNRKIALRELAVSGAEFNPVDPRPHAPRARARPALRQPLAVRRADPQQRGHRAGSDAGGTRRAHECA